MRAEVDSVYIPACYKMGDTQNFILKHGCVSK